MSACHTLRSCSPFKTVLNKLGDSYQTYISTYKTHTMATHHWGAGQPSDRDPTPHEQSTDIPSDHHHEDMDNFWECGTWNPHHPEGPHQTPRWLVTQSWDCWRSAYRSHKLPGAWALQIIPSISFISTTGTSWWCPTAIHRNLMFCQKADHFCKYTKSGYTHLQW